MKQPPGVRAQSGTAFPLRQIRPEACNCAQLFLCFCGTGRANVRQPAGLWPEPGCRTRVRSLLVGLFRVIFAAEISGGFWKRANVHSFSCVSAAPGVQMCDSPPYGCTACFRGDSWEKTAEPGETPWRKTATPWVWTLEVYDPSWLAWFVRAYVHGLWKACALVLTARLCTCACMHLCSCACMHLC